MRAWNKRTRDSMPSTMLRHRVGFLVGWLVARELIIKITQNRRTTVEQPAGTPRDAWRAGFGRSSANGAKCPLTDPGKSP